MWDPANIATPFPRMGLAPQDQDRPANQIGALGPVTFTLNKFAPSGGNMSGLIARRAPKATTKGLRGLYLRQHMNLSKGVCYE